MSDDITASEWVKEAERRAVVLHDEQTISGAKNALHYLLAHLRTCPSMSDLNAQLCEQNISLDQRCAELEKENDALRSAPIKTPVGFVLVEMDKLSFAMADEIAELKWGEAGICPNGFIPSMDRFHAVLEVWKKTMAVAARVK